MNKTAFALVAWFMTAVGGNAMADELTIPGHEVARGHKNYMFLNPNTAELSLVENGKIIKRITTLVGESPKSDLVTQGSTPAGNWPTNYFKGIGGAHDDIVIFACRTEKVCPMIHSIIPTQKRLKALQTPTPSDNNITNGCINVSLKDLSIIMNYVQRHGNTTTQEGPRFFVLPRQSSEIPKYFPGYRP